MNQTENDCDIIWTIGELEKWLGRSKPTIGKLIKRGMPCDKFDGQWCFVKSEINEWFKKRAASTKPKNPEDAE